MSDFSIGFDLDSATSVGQKKTFTKQAKIEQGNNDFRILPPYHDPVNKRIQHVWNVHWLTGPQGKFQVECPYYTERYCPVCERHREVDAKMKEAQLKGNTSEYQQLKEEAFGLSRSKSVYLNALNSNNDAVILRLSQTVFNLLAVKLKEASNRYDPTDPKTGVWFRFTRSGSGMAAVTVDFRKNIKTMADGQEAEVVDRTPIPDSVIEVAKGKVVDVHDPAALNIKIHTGRELQGFLDGEPLTQQKPGTRPSLMSTGSMATKHQTHQTQGQAYVQPNPVGQTAEQATKVQAQLLNGSPKSGSSNIDINAELEHLSMLSGQP